MAYEHCCCECRKASRRNILEVRPRAAGANLSVDVIVDGWLGNACIPPNLTREPRVDHIRIGGESFDITVRPSQCAITHRDIRRTA